MYVQASLEIMIFIGTRGEGPSFFQQGGFVGIQAFLPAPRACKLFSELWECSGV